MAKARESHSSLRERKGAALLNWKFVLPRLFETIRLGEQEREGDVVH
jgi:hypothetical protein